jgi:hypothetical protein
MRLDLASACVLPSGSDLARVFAVNRAEKLPELSVLSDRRPGPLDEFLKRPLRQETVSVIRSEPFDKLLRANGKA